MQTILTFENGSIKTIVDFGNPQQEQTEDLDAIYNQQMQMQEEQLPPTQTDVAQVAPNMIPGYPQTPIINGSSYGKLHDTDLHHIRNFQSKTKGLTQTDIKGVLEMKYGSGW